MKAGREVQINFYLMAEPHPRDTVPASSEGLRSLLGIVCSLLSLTLRAIPTHLRFIRLYIIGTVENKGRRERERGVFVKL